MSDGRRAVSRSAARAERIAAVGYDYAARDVETVGACNLCGSTDLAELSRRDR